MDVARMLIEEIRATVSEESRRKALMEGVHSSKKMQEISGLIQMIMI
jgi:hypothetical protein